jgi:hypothetical protein
VQRRPAQDQRHRRPRRGRDQQDRDDERRQRDGQVHGDRLEALVRLRSLVIAAGGPAKVTSCSSERPKKNSTSSEGRPVTTTGSVPLRIVADSGAGRPSGPRATTGTPALRVDSFADPLTSFQSSSSSLDGEVAGVPPRPGPAQVLVVDEVLQRVGEPLDAGSRYGVMPGS